MVLKKWRKNDDDQDGEKIGYRWLRLHGFEPRGGGGRRAKPLLQGEMGLIRCWDEDFTKVLDHLSPEAGGIIYINFF